MRIIWKKLKILRQTEETEVLWSLSLLLDWLLDCYLSLLNLDLCLLRWNGESLSCLSQLVEHASGSSAGISVWMFSHVCTCKLWWFLLQLFDLSTAIINGEVFKESLWSLFVFVLDLLWCSVGLSLFLSLTTIEWHVNRDDTFVKDSAVCKEVLVLECLDTVLEFDILSWELEAHCNFVSKMENRVKKSVCNINE